MEPEKDIDYEVQLQFPGYNLYINKEPCRGIALYVRSDFDITRRGFEAQFRSFGFMLFLRAGFSFVMF